MSCKLCLSRHSLVFRDDNNTTDTTDPVEKEKKEGWVLSYITDNVLSKPTDLNSWTIWKNSFKFSSTALSSASSFIYSLTSRWSKKCGEKTCIIKWLQWRSMSWTMWTYRSYRLFFSFRFDTLPPVELGFGSKIYRI